MAVGFAREFLQITQESSYLTPIAVPVRGTSQIAIRLEDGNSFSMRPTPITQSVMYGGGYNVEADTISDKTQLKGTLKTTLCYSQANLLLGAALTKINSAQTSPWTTTEPANQLASVTIDHAIWADDTGAYKRTRYLGCKVDAGSLSSSEDGQKFVLSLDLNGSTYQGNTYDSSTDPTSTVFPQPSDNEYPTDYVLFIHANGGFSIDSAAFAEFLSLNCSWQYGHVLNFFANRFVQKQRSWGRKVKLDADVILRASPDFRAAFQTLAAKTLSLALTNGTHTITLDWKTKARIEGLDDDLPLGTNYQRKLSLGSRYDTTNNVDFTFTYA
jgi:hypothetical protein